MSIFRVTLVEGYIEQSRNLKGFLLLIDSRRGIQEEEAQLIEYLLSLGKKICPILTKSDKLGRQQKSLAIRETTEALSGMGGVDLLPVMHSSKTGEGIDLIRRWIDERIADETE